VRRETLNRHTGGEGKVGQIKRGKDNVPFGAGHLWGKEGATKSLVRKVENFAEGNDARLEKVHELVKEGKGEKGGGRLREKKKRKAEGIRAP